MFNKHIHTVDGRNPADQLRLVVYPINLQGFTHPRWCRIFFHQQYDRCCNMNHPQSTMALKPHLMFRDTAQPECVLYQLF